jgi:hypothetical protein
MAYLTFSLGLNLFIRESKDTTCDDCVNVGFSHMAAALMAMEHFNTRNASVVSEIGELYLIRH